MNSHMVSDLKAQIRTGTPLDVEDAWAIAKRVVDPEGKGLNDHFQKVSFSLLTGVILHVVYAEPDKTLRGVVAYLSNPRAGLAGCDRCNPDAFEKMTKAEHDPEGRFHWKDRHGEAVRVHPVIAQIGKELLNRPDNEQSGITSTMMYFLSEYASR